jgi:hypothetical protein
MTTATDQPTGPRTGRPPRRLLLAAAVVLLLASLGTTGVCRKGAASSAPRSSRQRERVEEAPVASIPIAHQPLALARYRMLRKVERELGYFPLYGSIEYQRAVVFPRNRADKVYLYDPYGWNWLVRGYRGEQILCFESRGGTAKLLYWTKLAKVPFQPPKRTTPVRSMLDFISMLGSGDRPDRTVDHDRPQTYRFALPANISKKAGRDLASRQDLVDYWYQPMNSVLYVARLSAMVDEWLFKHYQSFEASEDPTPWFRVYGLPLADFELAPQSKQKP